jgi:hypothetical protein
MVVAILSPPRENQCCLLAFRISLLSKLHFWRSGDLLDAAPDSYVIGDRHLLVSR